MIIDFHTHIFPEKIAARTVEVLEENIAKNHTAPNKAVIGATDCDLLTSMKESGVDLSVVLPIATTVKQSETINNYAKKVCETDGLLSFGSLHPHQENIDETLEGIKAMGLKGIKLHPEYQGFYIDSPESLRVLKKCSELDLIVVLHTGKDIGVPPPVHCAPNRLKKVLQLVPDAKIVAAHLGGWCMWDEVEEFLAGENIYFDTCFTHDFIDKEQFIRIIKNHGSDKIMFGTDSPWSSQRKSIEYIKSLNLSKEDEENIFCKTAKKLLGI